MRVLHETFPLYLQPNLQWFNAPDTDLGENARHRECLVSGQRRAFPPEFKQQETSLVLDHGDSHIEASRSVGIGESVLRRWMRQLQSQGQGITPQSKAITPGQQRIQELQTHIERLEREKSILEMATVLLSSEGGERRGNRSDLR